MENRIPKRSIAIYYIVFFAVWALLEWTLRPWLSLNCNEWVAAILRSGLIKPFVWVLPSAILISKYEQYMLFTLKEMFTNKVRWIKYFPILLAFTLYILAYCYFVNGRIAISERFTASYLIVVLFVGISEEMVFRGWLLNAVIKNSNVKLVLLFNAILFLTIHFPKWIYEGNFIHNFINGSFLNVLILSVIFSYSFIKSKSIMVPIVLHMYWDLIGFLFTL